MRIMTTPPFGQAVKRLKDLVKYKGPAPDTLKEAAAHVLAKTRTAARKVSWLNPDAAQVFLSQLRVEIEGHRIILRLDPTFEKIAAEQATQSVLEYIKRAREATPADTPKGTLLIEWQMPENVSRLEEVLRKRWLPTDYPPERLLQLGVERAKPHLAELVAADVRRQLSK